MHEIILSPQLRKALPALTGCDTVSQLSGHGKKTAWKVFQQNARLLDKLGKQHLTNQILKNAEKFVCKLYSPETETSSPKGNDRSPESNVPRSNLTSKNIKMGHGNQRPETELV